MDFRYDHLLGADGGSLHGVFVALGQMSYWGAQVIVSLFGAIPVVGMILRCGFGVIT